MRNSFASMWSIVFDLTIFVFFHVDILLVVDDWVQNGVKRHVIYMSLFDSDANTKKLRTILLSYNCYCKG
jgi:hypothetical protein